jgi:hypothetical protein
MPAYRGRWTAASVLWLLVVRQLWLLSIAGLVGVAACSRLLDFSEVTGGEPIADSGSTGDAAGDAAVSCSGGTTDCGGACVDLAGNQAHCGACNVDCGGGACQNSLCGPYVVSKVGCHSVVADASGAFAYVTHYVADLTSTIGGVYKVDLKTGETTGLALGQHGAVVIVLDGDVLFWSTETATSTQVPRAIWRLELQSQASTPTRVYPDLGAPAGARPFGLKVADGFVYFADRAGAIGRLPVAGGSSEILHPTVPGEPLNLDVLGSWIYYTERNAALNTDAVKRLSRTPATPPDPPENVLTGLEGAWGVTARELPSDDGGVQLSVFTSIANGAAVARSRPTGGFSTLTISNQLGVLAPDGAEITLVDDTLYWATRGGVGGTIQTHQLGSSGNAATFAEAHSPVGITRVGDFLYWCSLTDGLVRTRL